MIAHVIICRDPFRPGFRREHRTISRRSSIRALAPRTQQPFICIYNGQPLLRAEWHARVRDGDVVLFVVLLQGGGGGGGKNPLSVVMSLAMMVIAPQLALSALGTVPGAYMATWLGGTHIFMAVAQGVISLAGAALVNALVPPPKPSVAQQLAAAGPSPTYTLAAQGNAARIGAPIPAIYGRHIAFPDFGAQPYSEYAGNEQFLYQLLVIGQGEYEIEQIRIEDTVVQQNPVADGSIQTATGVWSDIQYQICYDRNVTLFPTNVTTSAEVSGQEALTGTALGPFVANASGTIADALAVDVICPRGLFGLNGSSLAEKSVSFTVEARTIDDAGAPTGSWTTLGNHTVSGATTTPQRYSFRYQVTAARYEVRLTRTDTKDTSSTVGHDLLWSGLRAYLPGAQNYGKITVLALRMKASNQLSNLSARKINCIVTRKLPIWNGSSWSAPTATRNPAWALADMLRAEYGGNLADARIDLAALLSLASTWDARQDCYDAVHDSVQTLWEALGQCARAGRAMPYMQGGIVRVVRDSQQSVPTAYFSGRNIVRGSLRLEYVLPHEDTADCVDVEYFDAEVWAPRTVRAVLSGGTQASPAQVKLFGVTSRDQAWREAMYMAAANRYRRRQIAFATEMEGLIPSLGDLIAVSHDMPQWGQYGEIVAWDANSRTATLSESLDWSGSGPWYMALRKRDGSLSGPWQVTRGPRDDVVSFGTPIDITPDTGGERERTHFAFGGSGALYMLCRVIGIKPRSPEQVDIVAVAESDYVHTADTGSPPGPGAWQLPSDFTVPVVAGLVARAHPGDVGKALISWRPAPGADRYLIEIASGKNPDNPANVWTRVGETSASHFSTLATYGADTLFRVAAIGATRGPWVGVLYGSSADYMWSPSGDPMWTPSDATYWV